MDFSRIIAPIRLVAFCLFALGVGSASFALNCLCFCLIRPFSKSNYQKCLTAVCHGTFLLSNFVLKHGNVKMVIHGDKFPSTSNNILISNHVSTIDWLLIPAWLSLHGYPYPGNFKCVVKDSLSKIPVFGWIMAQAEFLFLTRSWSSDHRKFASKIRKIVEYARNTSYPLALLIFPEGTRISSQKIVLSKEYSSAQNFPLFSRLLFPRFTGFKEIVTSMGEATDNVVDITLLFDAPVPSLLTTLMGNETHVVNIYSKVHRISDIPTDREGLQGWLLEKWTEKETLLKKFEQDKLSVANPDSAMKYESPQLYPLFILFALSLVSLAFIVYYSIIHHIVFLLSAISILFLILPIIATLISNILPTPIN